MLVVLVFNSMDVNSWQICFAQTLTFERKGPVAQRKKAHNKNQRSSSHRVRFESERAGTSTVKPLPLPPPPPSPGLLFLGLAMPYVCASSSSNPFQLQNANNVKTIRVGDFDPAELDRLNSTIQLDWRLYAAVSGDSIRQIDGDRA